MRLITKQIEAIIYGTLLGDAWLKKTYNSRHNNSWQTAQKEKSKGYVEWLYRYLKPICTREPYLRVCKSGFPNDERLYRQYYLDSKALPFFTYLRKVFYKDSRKRVNQRILSHLTPLGLACWYMDDGSFLTPNQKGSDCHKLVLCTQGYSEKENRLIQDYFLRKWKIKFLLGNDRDKFFLRANVSDALKFIGLIKPYVNQVECMKYKITFHYSMINKSHHKAEYLQVFPEDKDIV